MEIRSASRQPLRCSRVVALALAIASVIFAVPCRAEMPAAERVVPLVVEDAVDNRGGAGLRSGAKAVHVSGARWLRIIFAAVDLPDDGELVVEGEEREAIHRLDARELRSWNNTSAYFNGDRLRVTLRVPEGTRGSYRIEQVIADDPAALRSTDSDRSDVGIPIGIDERAYIKDLRIGRTAPAGCTAWLTSTGLGLSAGHCYNPNNSRFSVIQFNVPPSLSDGTIQNPPPRDQFPVRSITASTGAPDPAFGDDWLVFTIDAKVYAPDGAGNERPFFRLAAPPTVASTQLGQITGYGVYPAPRSGPWDARNRTEQTNVGQFNGICTSGNGNQALAYLIDTAPANSGSPVFLPATGVAIGIHTTGTRSSMGGTCTTAPSNYGTPSTDANLLAAITSMVKGTNGVATFVDFAQPTTDPVGAGTPLNPYRDLSTALANAVAGTATVLNLAPGHYAPNGITISANAASGSMIVIGPSAGTVGIGPYPAPN